MEVRWSDREREKSRSEGGKLDDVKGREGTREDGRLVREKRKRMARWERRERKAVR